MAWTVYNFDCGDAGGRERLVEWFGERYEVVDDDGPERGLFVNLDPDGQLQPQDRADLAWVGEYLYVGVRMPEDEVLTESAAHWERAVRAKFIDEREICLNATLYRSSGGRAIEEVTYEGEDGMGGIDVMYVFAMVHQFRFRAYARKRPAGMGSGFRGGHPAQPQVDFPSAFDAARETDPESEVMRELTAQTGVEPTGAGIAFARLDPELPAEERVDPDDTLGRLRAHVQSRLEVLRTQIEPQVRGALDRLRPETQGQATAEGEE